ncbi:Adenine/guanine permease [Seminavis robusta]|uniref:Adenine/guanine permease n=1 Tax=Seminavis robusta TaxID=568900 RepID=A0A9N8HLV7_9STRA|nr:Adenine/guanine permease [Seminavis robusta]|eukprot:Sro856_g211600.1 Adenine/guanine permease (473) ;mRNA; f:28582-30000
MTITETLDNYFSLTERGATIGGELRAGTASFLTLSYLLLVNPQIMAQAGVSHDDAVFATALSASIACFIVGFCANLPFGCAPGIGLSAYLAFGLVQAELCTLEEALTVCWWSGIVVIMICLSRLTVYLMKIVPQSIKYGIVVGMGLLIAMIGMVDVNMIVSDEKTLVKLGDVMGDDGTLALCLCGILLVASLLYHDVKGGILIGIAVLTLFSWTWKHTWPESIFQWPEFHNNGFLDHPLAVFDWSRAAVFLPALASFVLICIFDISGVIYGLATLGGLITPEGDIPGSFWTFIASGVGTLVAAYFGSTPIIVCVETASGVREGGRTGLTAVVIGLYFMASIFLSPLFTAVPEVATAPVLVMVGVMMMGEAAKIKWENMDEALPAFLTIILMPLTYSITNGMIFGLLSAAAFYFTTGQAFTDTMDLFKNARAACTNAGRTKDNDANEVKSEKSEKTALLDVETGTNTDSGTFS